MKLFAPEGSAEGCASGECLPETAPQPLPPAARPLAVVQATPAFVAPPAPVAVSPPAPSAPRGPSPSSTLDEEDELGLRKGGVPPGDSEHERWRRAVDALRVALPRHGKSLSYARFLGFAPEGVRIAFAADAAFHRQQVVGMSRPLVEAELTKALGRPGKLVEESTSAEAYQSAPKSIAEVEASDRATRERHIEAQVRAHPAVRSVLRHLGGGIEHIQFLEPVAQELPAASPDEGEPPGSD